MNLKDLISAEIKNKPPRIVLHGVHGVGKSTFAAQAPKPIFIPTEDGLTNIKVDHFPVAKTMEDVFSYLGLLITESNEYKTVVIDTLDWLERLIWAHVCAEQNVKSIEAIGYGKGYLMAQNHWDRLLQGLDKLHDELGYAVVLLAHNEIKSFSPPDGVAYDRWQIKLYKTAAARIEEWADMVLFANFKTHINTTNQKVVNNSERVIYSANRPAWRAKTRYPLPDELNMDFNALLAALKSQPTPGGN